MNAMSLNKVYESVFLHNLKKTIMKLLSIMGLGNARTTNFYTAQYEQVSDVLAPKETKRFIKVKAPVNDIIEPGKNEAKEVKTRRPKINYFAGPHGGFNPHVG